MQQFISAALAVDRLLTSAGSSIHHGKPVAAGCGPGSSELPPLRFFASQLLLLFSFSIQLKGRFRLGRAGSAAVEEGALFLVPRDVTSASFSFSHENRSKPGQVRLLETQRTMHFEVINREISSIDGLLQRQFPFAQNAA